MIQHTTSSYTAHTQHILQVHEIKKCGDTSSTIREVLLLPATGTTASRGSTPSGHCLCPHLRLRLFLVLLIFIGGRDVPHPPNRQLPSALLRDLRLLPFVHVIIRREPFKWLLPSGSHQVGGSLFNRRGQQHVIWNLTTKRKYVLRSFHNIKNESRRTTKRKKIWW